VRVSQPRDADERVVEALAGTEGVRRARSPHAEAPASVWDALASPGRPLIGSERPAALGIDLETIRIHSGGSAARELQADAFTFGDDVVVGEGYEPGSAAGRRLLAHELAHVAQQRAGGEPVVHRQGHEEHGTFDSSHLLGTFTYRLDPAILAAAAAGTARTGAGAPAQTGDKTDEADPQEVGAAPYGSSLVSTSAINPAGTWTLSVGGGGVAARSSILSQPVVGGTTVTTSPSDTVQVQASTVGVAGPEGLSPGTQRAANLQVQVSPSQPHRLNRSLIAGVGYASNQGPAPDTLVPNAFATAIGEALLGGPDAAHARFSAAANISVIRTPYLNGILSDVSGASLGGALTLFSGYYQDAPAADPSDRRPVGITQTPRLTIGIAGNLGLYRGTSLDPTRAGELRTAGVDVFATYVSPLTRVAGSRGRWFVTLTPGVRVAAQGNDPAAVGVSGMVMIGWLTAAPPPSSLGNVEHP
jgi:hypothetical protein